MLMLMK